MARLKDFLKAQAKSLKPAFFSKQPHFNFISAHYFYILAQTILASVLLYTSGGAALSYIDALVFGSGAATQSGLNPVDVNLLNTFQQTVVYLVCMMCSPITINSFVVFLRLYWFEKKFQDLVKDARKRRSTFAQTRSKAKSVDHRQLNDMENGVNGRNITVMRNNGDTRITNDGLLLSPIPEPRPNGMPNTPKSSRDTDPTDDGLDSQDREFPQLRTTEEHVAILERQRNEGETLRIPGPRDVELGMAPERVEHSADEDAMPRSPRSPHRRRRSMESADGRAPGPRQQTIVIQEPTKPPAREEMAEEFEAIKNTLDPFKLRVPRIFKNKNPRLHEDDSDEEQEQTHLPERLRRRSTFGSVRKAFTQDKVEDTPYLSWTPTVARNSNFPGMSEEQREEMGGIEYRSLKSLAKVLVFYFMGFSVLGVVCLLPWILLTERWGVIVDQAGQSRTWWGFFTANSAFMDLGFTLTPDSMVSFNTATFPLLLMSFLIIIGNTGFPIMLRFLIWGFSLMVPRGSGLWEELRFLLDHPRRCFTLLFPAGATWWLFWILLALNGIDLIFFIVLDLDSGPVFEMPTGIKILNGIFQAASTRTAGFASVNLSQLHPAVLTSYIIMMYISVFPIAISVRRTNVYEESALGIYTNAEDDEQVSHIGSHFRRQLSFDLWFIFLGYFILSISEGTRLQSGDITMFAVLFEVVSAYGTVGLSLGYTNVNTSLVGQFSTVGKLVIVAMQIRGRHRGLPYGLDRAVLLPGDSRNVTEEKKEAAHADNSLDTQFQLHRRASGMSTATQGVGSSVRRGRSRSMTRVNSNVLVQLLHPGPAPIPHGPPMRRRSAADMEEEEYHEMYERSRSSIRRAETIAQVPIPSTGIPARH
ncbi:hypothetical protein MCOR17_005136 [Pyricularia oryzae]|nr:hypothetical protein MCOR17_005136 [Pyricularia oryzae]